MGGRFGERTRVTGGASDPIIGTLAAGLSWGMAPAAVDFVGSHMWSWAESEPITSAPAVEVGLGQHQQPWTLLAHTHRVAGGVTESHVPVEGYWGGTHHSSFPSRVIKSCLPHVTA